MIKEMLATALMAGTVLTGTGATANGGIPRNFLLTEVQARTP